MNNFLKQKIINIFLYVSFFIEYIKSLLGSGKPTFLYFGHQDVQEWIDVLQNCAPNAKTEMANLKKFLEPYQNISGLIIETITMEVIFNHLKCTVNDIFMQLILIIETLLRI